jgi:putative heme transporter
VRHHPRPTTHTPRKPLRPAAGGRIPFELTPRTVLIVLVTLGSLWLLVKLWLLLLLIVVAFILAGTMQPLVSALERRKVKRGPALAILFFAMTAITVGIGVLTLPPLITQVARIAGDMPRFQAMIADELGRHSFTQPFANTVRNAPIGTWLSENGSAYALHASRRALEILGYSVTVVFLALYLIADRERVRAFTYAIVPKRFHLRLARVTLNLETIVGGYVRGQLITSACIAGFTFVLLTIFRVPNAVALAVLAGVVDAIPLIGALLAVVPAALFAMSRGPGVAIAVLVALTLYQEFENRLLIPRIYGRTLRLPSSAVAVALIAGAMLLGIIGALLSLPIAAAIRMMLLEMRVELPGDESEDPELRRRDEEAERSYAVRTAGAPADEAAAVAVEIAKEIRAEDANGDEDKAAETPITEGHEDAHTRH